MRYLATFCAWVWFAAVQLICLIATIVGWLLLIPFCLAQAWAQDAISIKDGRIIDRWRWKRLNFIYGNPEDGVSGQTALVWVNGSLSFYRRPTWAPWRAYLWSGWRNSADNLKYVFAWQKGPLVEFNLFGMEHKLGWQFENGVKVPVLS